MVNSDEFAHRLTLLLNYYGHSPSSFADVIAFNRSSISHLLSGRNKPSLEFVLKVLENFPEVKLNWLMNGKGNFPDTIEPDDTENERKEKIKHVSTEKNLLNDASGASIERVVIFFKNGSFKSYEQ